MASWVMNGNNKLLSFEKGSLRYDIKVDLFLFSKLRKYYDFDSIEVLVAKPKTSFHRTLIHHENAVLRFLSHFNRSSVDMN